MFACFISRTCLVAVFVLSGTLLIPLGNLDAKPVQEKNKKIAPLANLLVNSKFLPRALENKQPVGWKTSTWGGEPIFSYDRSEGCKSKKGSVRIRSV